MDEILSEGYGIMPNKVLFDKNLTDKQKLLYCLISSLCAEKWYCRASNEYLWERLNADKKTISKNVSDLANKWFISVEVSQEEGNKRKIGIAQNEYTYTQKWGEGYTQKWVHNNIIYNNTIEYTFSDFWKDYPHARKWKKKDSEEYFSKQNPESVKKQVSILKRKIKAWLQEWQYVPACERWIRDFTELNEDVVKQDLVRICRRHINAWGDAKQRSQELKETFGEETINAIVKEIQKKPAPLFTN